MFATWKSVSSIFHTMSVNHHKLNKKSCNFIISYINLWLGHARCWINFNKKSNWIEVFMVIDLMTGKIRGYFILWTKHWLYYMTCWGWAEILIERFECVGFPCSPFPCWYCLITDHYLGLMILHRWPKNLNQHPLTSHMLLTSVFLLGSWKENACNTIKMYHLRKLSTWNWSMYKT